MNFGFSYVGLIFLLMLYVPNIIWSMNKPKDYEDYVKKENRTLQSMERIGEVLVTCIVLVFKDFNVQGLSWWLIWLVIAFILMIIYELFWIRYFRSPRTMKDFYSSFLRIPVAGATLPVIAALFIAVYGKNIFLFISAIILGIGHIGIHLQHSKEVSGK